MAKKIKSKKSKSPAKVSRSPKGGKAAKKSKTAVKKSTARPKKKSKKKSGKPSKGLSEAQVKDQAAFWHRLAAIMPHGISLLRALEMAGAECEDRELFESIIDLRDKIREGAQMSVAMAEKPEMFPPIACLFLGLGEKAGKVDEFSKRIADLMDRGLIKGSVYEVPPMPEASAEEKTSISAVDAVNRMFLKAIRERARAIHVEVGQNEVTFRLRMPDGLKPVDRQPKQLARQIINRYKVMAGLDLAEARKPQRGRIELRVDDSVHGFTVATMPTDWGENVTVTVE